MRMRSFPAPTNLQVLPKDLTGQQMREIMEHWAGSLGVHCDTCHAADPKNIAPNGRPRLNFADDSKPEKNTARLMFTMAQDINSNYVRKVPDAARHGDLWHLPSWPAEARAVCDSDDEGAWADACRQRERCKGRRRQTKGSGVSRTEVCSGFRLKGTGFSPYIGQNRRGL